MSESTLRTGATAEPFSTGTVVMVILNNPREKYWGSIQGVTPAGVALRGLDINSFEDFTRQINAGERVAPHMVFFPMHRVERMEMDVRDGEIPSMRERFETRTGRSWESVSST